MSFLLICLNFELNIVINQINLLSKSMMYTIKCFTVFQKKKKSKEKVKNLVFVIFLKLSFKIEVLEML